MWLAGRGGRYRKVSVNGLPKNGDGSSFPSARSVLRLDSRAVPLARGHSSRIVEKSSFLEVASRFVIGIGYSSSAIVARFPA
jgi:hypothetical protein